MSVEDIALSEGMVVRTYLIMSLDRSRIYSDWSYGGDTRCNSSQEGREGATPKSKL